MSNWTDSAPSSGGGISFPAPMDIVESGTVNGITFEIQCAFVGANSIAVFYSVFGTAGSSGNFDLVGSLPFVIEQDLGGGIIELNYWDFGGGNNGAIYLSNNYDGTSALRFTNAAAPGTYAVQSGFRSAGIFPLDVDA